MGASLVLFLATLSAVQPTDATEVVSFKRPMHICEAIDHETDCQFVLNMIGTDSRDWLVRITYDQQEIKALHISSSDATYKTIETTDGYVLEELAKYLKAVQLNRSGPEANVCTGHVQNCQLVLSRLSKAPKPWFFNGVRNSFDHTESDFELNGVVKYGNQICTVDHSSTYYFSSSRSARKLDEWLSNCMALEGSSEL